MMENLKSGSIGGRWRGRRCGTNATVGEKAQAPRPASARSTTPAAYLTTV